VSEHPLQLRAAYSVCRHIARSAAKNFYYGFLLLPHRKRDALSAVYAFMRRADDISDDPSLPAEQRRQKLEEWMKALREVADGGRTDDPVLFALADSQKRFNIPSRCWKAGEGDGDGCPGRRGRAAAIRNLQSALRLLLSRGIGRWAGMHSHLWLSRSAGGEAGGRSRESRFSSPTSFAM
jgi:hypothetical protein